jgi:hypothetical protein
MAWKTWLDTVVGVAILAALPVAVISYFEAHNANRAAVTLSYLTRYRSSPLVESTIDLAEAYSSPEAKAFMQDQKPLDTAGWEARTLSFNKSRYLKKKVQFVTFFFDDFYSCLSQRLCDLELFGTSDLRNDLQTFYVISKSLLDEMNREEQWSYGDSDSPGARGCGLTALFSTLTPDGFDEAGLKKHACPGT